MKGQRKKAHWAKKRIENAEKRKKEREENLQRKYKRPTKIFVELKPRVTRVVITDDMAKTASLPSHEHNSPIKYRPRSEPKTKFSVEEYQRRETEAKKEIERKKKRVAVMYNKGGYQYIGDAPAEVVKDLGKKV